MYMEVRKFINGIHQEGASLGLKLERFKFFKVDFVIGAKPLQPFLPLIRPTELKSS